MHKQFSLLEIILISLAIANLVSMIYLEPKGNSAVAAPNGEMVNYTSPKCQCPKTPPAN